MIGYIKGSLEYIGEGFVIIEAYGIGYNINVTDNTAARLTKKAGDVKLYTVMNVREDAISLYGFAERDELEMYKMLNAVSGVGPKAAIAMLSALTPQEISIAVMAGDSKRLALGKGIGKKTAERIVLELKDKIKAEDVISDEYSGDADVAPQIGSSEKSEACEALESLGFSRSEVYSSVSKAYKEGMSAEEIIKIALKLLSK